MVVAGIELRRRQGRAGRLVEFEKLDDVADHLGKDKTVAARNDRHRARAEAPQLVEAAFVRHYVDRLELDPTDREVLLYPKAARSMRLPEDLNRFAHGHALDHCRDG